MQVWYRDNRNLIISMDRDEDFSMTGYKVVTNQGKDGFAECRKILFNGKPQLWYDTAPYESLEKLLPKLKRGQLCTVLHNMAEIVCRTEENGFLDIGNIQMDLSDIYADPDSLDVYLIYLPAAGGGACDQAAMVRTFLNGIDRSKTVDDSIKEEMHAVWMSRSFDELKKSTGQSASPMNKDKASVTAHQSGVTGTGVKLEAGEETGRLLQHDKASKGGFLRRAFGRNGNKARETKMDPDASTSACLENEVPMQPPVSREVKPDSLILSGTSAGRVLTFCIDADDFKLGKKKEAVDGCIDTSPAVSRIHCEIQRRSGDFYIRDLESANGTFVNGIRLNTGREFRLRRGDKVKLADVELGVL